MANEKPVVAPDPSKRPAPPGADPRGRWYQRPTDGEWVWRVENAEARTNPSDAVLVERQAKARTDARAAVFPTPRDVELSEADVAEALKQGYEWVEGANGRKVLRKQNAVPDMRPRPSDADLALMAVKGELKFPSRDEVAANVALTEALRVPDGRQRVDPAFMANPLAPRLS